VATFAFGDEQIADCLAFACFHIPNKRNWFSTTSRGEGPFALERRRWIWMRRAEMGP
jgi:hypothetical protein